MNTATVPSHSAAAAAPPARSMLSTQTAGSLVRNIVHMYRSHPGVLLICSVLPTLPPMLLLMWLAQNESPLLPLALLLYVVAGFLAGGALTVAISDICCGNRPSPLRALRRVTSDQRWWDIAWSGFLLSLGVMLGMLALVLPGLWLLARGFLVSVVATLEGRNGRAAIRRSFELTQGQTWRMMGLALLPVVMAYVVMVLLLLPASFAVGLLVQDRQQAALMVMAISMCLSLALFVPVFSMTMVLLYYDQRVRREAYDVQALAEDLMR